MGYLTNATGAVAGNQKVGNVTVNFGVKPTTENIVSPSTDDEGYGAFEGAKSITLTSISGKYEDRFDDVTYYG
jgi:hypothetical protein